MKFDWSMVKTARNQAPAHDPEPRPSAPWTAQPRFAVPEGSYPVSVDPGLPLLDFITWCVPDDGSADLGAIGRLYESVSGDEFKPNGPAPR